MPSPHKVISAYLQTGQITCHDARGSSIDCTGSGQDADFKRGVPWPAPRFEVLDEAVLDRLTRLVWTRNANMAEFPLAWQEALDFIAIMNRDNLSLPKKVKSFNPRAHAGRDGVVRKSAEYLRCFNPRARAGCDS